MEVSWNFRFGILLLGESAVGKSSLLQRYTEGTFITSRLSPLGIDFKVHDVVLEAGVKVKLLLWDTAGQERFRSITKSYMRNSVGCLLVFDVTQRQTFDRVRSWHQEVLNYVKPNPMLFLLVGHKCDLGVQRQVTESEGKALAEQLRIDGYLEVSSKDNINVGLAFETLASVIYQQFQKHKIAVREGWHGLTVGAQVAEEPPQTNKSCCYCG
ncbi:ras-related protein Rab-39B [Denticeps clupeoides]|uniref:Uncharacterized protein n=1 Tax=Denticeps clupeoides TaxID=299321 RepID=A0AAY4DLJ4_9TELE|nr:ras-related protein Rab-39B-like [Denticeps clupeoides]